MHGDKPSLQFLLLVVLLLACVWKSCEDESNSCRSQEKMQNDETDNVPLPSRIRPPIGRLSPSDLDGFEVFQNFSKPFEVSLPMGHSRNLREANVEQVHALSSSSEAKSSQEMSKSASVTLVESAIPSEVVDKLRELLESYEEFDADPDSVDGMPTHEIFMDSPDLRHASDGRIPIEPDETAKVLDFDPESLKTRNQIRSAFRHLTQGYVEEILSPLVRLRFPEVCQSGLPLDNNRRRPHCKPCYSLVRRYRHGERQSHATHLDGHALVTIVVSLSRYNRDYTGGLYVSSVQEGGTRRYIPLNEGDAAMHQSNLFHGVQVYDKLDGQAKETTRWSWILWYKDSCEIDYSHEWFAECASTGDPVCQYLYSTKDVPGETNQQATDRIVKLTIAAANGGIGVAAVKLARAYLHLVPSPLPYDEKAAFAYYKKGIEARNPDAHYGMAHLTLLKLRHLSNSARQPSGDEKETILNRYMRKVVNHLEEAAILGSAFAMFNLGMVHAFGYSVGGSGEAVDTHMSHKWFVRSGLPEALFIASQQAMGFAERGITLENDSGTLLAQARKAGWEKSWRRAVRDQTGPGGSGGGGVDLLNLPWPVSPTGSRPPKV